MGNGDCGVKQRRTCISSKLAPGPTVISMLLVLTEMELMLVRSMWSEPPRMQLPE
jgi:hypothetical protein